MRFITLLAIVGLALALPNQSPNEAASPELVERSCTASSCNASCCKQAGCDGYLYCSNSYCSGSTCHCVCQYD